MAIGDYSEIEPFQDFAQVVRQDAYRPLPDDWLVGVSDVVDSTSAIRAGRYKAVNMAGAATISAVTNALGGKLYPFVFGGDGARFAIHPDDAAIAREAMARTASWVRRDLDLDLRVALIPIADIRQAGHDVRVARYAAAPGVTYAMFSGGGVEWAERQAKAGRFAVAPASPGSAPDLTGLSCQWGPFQSVNGVILSVIVKPKADADAAAFAATIQELLGCLEREQRINPVPEDGPEVRWPADSLALQSRAIKPGSGSGTARWLLTLLQTLVSWLLFKTNWKVRGFDPGRYRRQIALNSDFRKYDDGLMMTVDCSEAGAAAFERILERARSNGIADYGLHRQETALMTCVVPSVLSDGHLHFIDGGSGGYTEAARQLKGAPD